MRAPSRIVITGSSIARQATCASGIGTPVPREPERRLDEPRPRKAAVRVPELAEPGGDAGHRARRRPDRVVDELRAERHVEVDELRLMPLGAEARDGAEAVEVPRGAGRRVVVDRVAAAEQPGHHRLGDARRERRRNRRVGGAAAVGEDLGARRRRRGMPGRASWPARRAGCLIGSGRRGSASQPMRAMPARGKSSRWLISAPPA